MAQLYGKKTSDGLPKALECTDEGLLKVDTELTATIDPAGLATEATLADLLTKIIAAPSTEAKQDLILTALGLIATEATAGDIKTTTEALAALISAGALAVSLAELPDTAAGDMADINTASASIDDKLPAIGQQLKVASLSIVPASDADDVKVSLDSEVVAINGGVGQTDDIKVTLDSESVAVTGPLTDAQLTTQALAKEATLASMSADLGTVRTNLAAVKADIALMKADLAKKLEKVQLHVAIDFSSADARTIIAAPGEGDRIRLTRLSLSSGGTPQVNVEVALKSGSTTIETVKGSAMVFDYPEHRNLGTNEAFVIQTTTADRIIGGVDYYVEAVF